MPGAKAGARLRVAVVGAGWAGLAAAVEATARGHHVSLFEMARHAGGRARSDAPEPGTHALDNGQHILIGAYQDTLALMRRVGVVPDAVLRRQPLTLRYADGSGLSLPTGPAAWAFVRGVLAWRDVPLRDRLGLLRWAAGWQWRGFRCSPTLTVADIGARCPPRVMRDLLDPLSVAALNTPSDTASAQVLLTVLRDALFGPRGSADLLLPRAPLNALLPEAALRWLAAHGAQLHLGERVDGLTPSPNGWQVHTRQSSPEHDRVIVATPAREAGRLLAPHAPDWAARAQALRYEPIITVWLDAPGARWPHPMLALRADEQRPAQFGFDLGQLGGPAGRFSLVVSGATRWLDRPLADVGQAVQAQLADAWAGNAVWPVERVRIHAVRAEKRATFACTPGLARPDAHPLPGLWVAGDHVAGPYPATLEGAVRAGLHAARQL